MTDKKYKGVANLPKVPENSPYRLLSVLMPVYNEQLYIQRSIEAVLDAPITDEIDIEIIIVDDGSTDGTPALLEHIAAEHPDKIKLFRQPQNMGKGAAIRKAISKMNGDLAIIQDGDLEYSPVEYPVMLDPILKGRADVVYGSRFLASPQRRVLNYHHAIGNQIITHFSNICTGLNLSDMETCYKAFRGDVLRSIPVRSNRFGIEVEITAKIARRKLMVYEVPISYHGRTYSEGKKITWKDGLQALFLIIKFKFINDSTKRDIGPTILSELSAAQRFSQWMIRVIQPHLGKRILEIGSGIGNISKQLPQSDRLTLTDVDDTYIEKLKQTYGDRDFVDVRKLDLTKDDGFEACSGQYDSVICLNVLEHIDEDIDALRRMSTLLEKNGRLIILVPQYEFLMSNMDHQLGHYRRYSRESLTSKMESAGLKVSTVHNFNSLGVVGWFISNKLLRRTSLGKFQIKIYDLLVPIMSLLEKYLPLPGLSIIAIGEKE